MFQGLQKSSLSIVLFLTSCFRTVLLYGRHLHIQSERRRSSMETEDMMMQGETEKSSCEFEELDLNCVAACGM